MSNKIIISIILISLVFLSCDNNTKVNQSKLENKQESEIIKNEKIVHEKQIDSLNYEIKKIKEEKNNKKYNTKFAEAEIYNLLKSSYLDHVIIGSKDLLKSELLLKEKLGFTTKKGREHENGITNFFVDFKDSSEVEIMSVKNPKDKLVSRYNSLLDNNQYGFQFAIRTNSLEKLTENFKEIKSEYSVLAKNEDYSTLSTEIFSKKYPLFFIQYKDNSSSQTIQGNNTNGISAVWLSTPNIRKSIEQYSNFGFSLIDTISVANIKSKTALMKNDNFDIILIEDESYSITGVTIKTNNIEKIQKILIANLRKDVRITENKRGKSIYLSPQITNSIWFEFLEN